MWAYSMLTQQFVIWGNKPNLVSEGILYSTFTVNAIIKTEDSSLTITQFLSLTASGGTSSSSASIVALFPDLFRVLEPLSQL